MPQSRESIIADGPITKKSALEAAQTWISDVYQTAPGQYGSDSWDEGRQVWWLGEKTTHTKARMNRASAVAELAAQFWLESRGIGMNDGFDDYAQTQYIQTSGTVRERMNQIIREVSS